MFGMRIDASNLMKAQAIIAARSKNSRAESLNKAVYFVIKTAKDFTPTTGVARIDSELNILTVPTVGKRGQLSGLVKKKGIVNFRSTRIVLGTYDFAAGKSSPPLAALIINASVIRPEVGPTPSTKRYNQLTGFRFARAFSPFRGVTRRVGAEKMTAAISRMVKARHSSGGFFKMSWNSILSQLKPYLPASYGGGNFGPKLDESFGKVSPALPAQSVATCIIENRIGMSGKNAVLDQKRNLAAHRILAPALQSAIDTQFHSALEKLDREQWQEAAPLLRQYGLEVAR